jgi:hypothetical protein
MKNEALKRPDETIFRAGAEGFGRRSAVFGL